MISPKLKKLLVPAYVLFLIFSFFYVRSVLEGVPVSQLDENKETVVKSKSITVWLKTSALGTVSVYKVSANDKDSVADLLLKTKENYSEFTYDRTAYSYGYEFEHVNNIKRTENFEWHLYDDDKDITMEMDSIKLSDGKTYLLEFRSKD